MAHVDGPKHIELVLQPIVGATELVDVSVAKGGVARATSWVLRPLSEPLPHLFR